MKARRFKRVIEWRIKDGHLGGFFGLSIVYLIYITGHYFGWFTDIRFTFLLSIAFFVLNYIAFGIYPYPKTYYEEVK